MSSYQKTDENTNFINDTCGARRKVTTLKRGDFSFDRGDSSSLPSSATGMGR